MATLWVIRRCMAGIYQIPTPPRPIERLQAAMALSGSTLREFCREALSLTRQEIETRKATIQLEHDKMLLARSKVSHWGAFTKTNPRAAADRRLAAEHKLRVYSACRSRRMYPTVLRKWT